MHGGGRHEHGHGHGPNAGLHAHEYETAVEKWALLDDIDTSKLKCLNEKRADSLKDVLRPWEDRLKADLPKLDSDVDEQLLMCIPFVSPVKISSISVIGAGGQASPAKMSAFVNNEIMDFASVESTKPVQVWDMVQENDDGSVVYPTNATKFLNVSTLWLFVSKNFGADSTSIMYIGLKGEKTGYHRKAVDAKYELIPQKKAGDVTDEVSHQIS